MRLAALWLLASGLCFAQEGHWEGAIRLPNRDVLISVDLDNGSGWRGSFTMPAVPGPALALENIEVVAKDHLLSFDLPDFPGAPSFRGVFDSETIEGTMKEGDQAVAFTLRRTGDPHVEAVPRSTHLTSEFVGDWKGVLQLDKPLRVLFHLSNDGAGIGKATLDTPETGMTGIRVTSVRQDDELLRIEVRILGGSFEGKMVQGGLKIEGQWSQNGRTVPLVLEK